MSVELYQLVTEIKDKAYINNDNMSNYERHITLLFCELLTNIANSDTIIIRKLANIKETGILNDYANCKIISLLEDIKKNTEKDKLE